MASIIQTKIAGLYTDANHLSSVPEGALAVAENIIIRAPDVAEPRRGMGKYSYSMAGASTAGYFLNNTLIWHSGTSLYKDTGAAFSAYSVSSPAGSTISAASSTMRMKSAQAAQSLWWATAAGVRVLDSTSGTIAEAGIRRALEPIDQVINDPVAFVTLTSGTGAWAWNNTNSSQAGYKVVIAKKDANGRLVKGEPSGRWLLANTSAADRFATAHVPYPSWLTTSHVVQLYRTETSPNATTDPGDDYYLVAEKNGIATATQAAASMARSAANITVTHTSHPYVVGDAVKVTPGESGFDAGIFVIDSITANTYTYAQTTAAGGTSNAAQQTVSPVIMFNDYTPDSLLNVPLYTNPTDGDIENGPNAQPPLCHDIALWNNRLWFARTTSKQRFTLNMLGASAPDGVQNADTITISGQTYTCATAAPANFTTFRLISSGSVSFNVEQTARNLVNAINNNPANTTVVARYVSGINDPPGQISIEEVGLAASTFSVYASRPASWFPRLTTGSSGAVTSSSDEAPNRLFYSKLNITDAVPGLNYLDIGAKNSEILRIAPLRDRLYVFKQDGLFVVSGSNSFRVDGPDATVILHLSDSIATVGNKIYALTTQGIVTVSEAGVSSISKPIERELLTRAFKQSSFGDQSYNSFALGCETDRLYILSLYYTPDQISFERKVYVYNIQTGTWVNWTWPAEFTAAVVAARGHTYADSILATSGTSVYYQRKTVIPSSTSDYYDDAYAITISSVGTLTLTLSALNTGVKTGDTIFHSGGGYYLVASVDSGGATDVVTLATTNGIALATGSATVKRSFACEVRWLGSHGSNPATLKHASEGSLFFQDRYFWEPEMMFRSDLSSTTTDPNFYFADRTFSSTYGDVPSFWVTHQQPSTKRVLVPSDRQRFQSMEVGFKITQAASYWRLTGFELLLADAEGRGNR